MREIEVNGRKISVRGITRYEIEKMQKDGLPINRWGITLDIDGDSAKAEQMFDAVLKIAVNGDDPVDIMAMTPAEERKLFTGIMAETFGSGDEEKNSSRSGNGTQTESE